MRDWERIAHAKNAKCAKNSTGKEPERGDLGVLEQAGERFECGRGSERMIRSLPMCPSWRLSDAALVSLSSAR